MCIAAARPLVCPVETLLTLFCDIFGTLFGHFGLLLERLGNPFAKNWGAWGHKGPLCSFLTPCWVPQIDHFWSKIYKKVDLGKIWKLSSRLDGSSIFEVQRGHFLANFWDFFEGCLLYTSPSPRD